MFSEGDYVVYGTNGVCKVEKITTLDFRDVEKDRKYYALCPVGSNGKLYVPVDSENASLRNMITRQEAQELLEKLPRIEPITIENEKLLEEMYKKCLRCYDCTEWVRLIKCIYARKQKRLQSGKKITSTDEKYMHLAEEALYSELGIALGIPRDQVLEYILEKMGKNPTAD